MAPSPNSPCRVMIENQTELPVTAVAHKWLLAHQLAPGESTGWVTCPSVESIEFQFAVPGTAYEDIEWAQPSLPFKAGRHYRVIVSGPPGARRFEVTEAPELA